MSSENKEKKKITLKGADGKLLEVDQEAAMRSKVIEDYIEGDGFSRGAVFPIPEVDSDILMNVFQYCEKIPYADPTKFKDFNKEYVNQVDNSTILEILRAADHLKVKDLLDFLCQEVADRIQDMSVEEVRDLFGIQNDLTPEEEQEIGEQNPLAFG